MNVTARLKQTLEVCDIHRERLEFATRELGPRFPLTVNTLLTLSGKEIAVLDQMVFRAHEYPSQNEEKAAGLNNVFESTPKLVDVYKKMKEYITQRLDAHAS